MGLETCWVLSQRPWRYHLNQLSIPATPVDWAVCWPQLFGHVSSIKDLSGLANHHLCHTEKLGQLFENDIGEAQETCNILSHW